MPWKRINDGTALVKGIVKNLFGTDEHYVLPVQKLNHDKDLTRGFEWLWKNENSIRQRLKTENASLHRTDISWHRSIK